MRGDQLARQWRSIRVIEASPNGLTVAEITKREGTGIRTTYRDLRVSSILHLTQRRKMRQEKDPHSYCYFSPNAFESTLRLSFLHSERFDVAQRSEVRQGKDGYCVICGLAGGW